MGLFLPGTWITMISMLKMAVVSQTFLAHVAKKGSVVLPVSNTSTTAWLSQNNLTFLVSPKLRPNFEGIYDIQHFQFYNMQEGHIPKVKILPQSRELGIKVHLIINRFVIKESDTIILIQENIKNSLSHNEIVEILM